MKRWIRLCALIACFVCMPGAQMSAAVDVRDQPLTQLLESVYFDRNKPLYYDIFYETGVLGEGDVILEKGDELVSMRLTYPTSRVVEEDGRTTLRNTTVDGTFYTTRYHIQQAPFQATNYDPDTGQTRISPEARNVLEGEAFLYNHLVDDHSLVTIEILADDGQYDGATVMMQTVDGDTRLKTYAFWPIDQENGILPFSDWARKDSVLKAIRESELQLDGLQIGYIDQIDYFAVGMYVLCDGATEYIWCPDYTYEPDGPVADEFREFSDPVIEEGLHPATDIIRKAITTTMERNAPLSTANPSTGR